MLCVDRFLLPLSWLFVLVVAASCSASETGKSIPVDELPQGETRRATDFSAALDCSAYPEMSGYNLLFTDRDGKQMSFVEMLSANDIRAVRLRVWVNPPGGYSSLSSVAAFADELRARGIRIWLSMHYSDSWADPGKQDPPAAWQKLDFDALRDSVTDYTGRVAKLIAPDVIQIGNEINDGFLHPHGSLSLAPEQCLALLRSGIEAVRNNAPKAAVMLHYAGIHDAVNFFEQMSELPYDLIGLSYYPIWHGKSLDALEAVVKELTNTHQRELWIAETAYPFTLDWNDWTHNIVGLESQLILPTYPATPEGQKRFLERLQAILDKYPLAKGLCYWGAELVAWKGPYATDASPWENQALFDFDRKALPALQLFGGK